MPASIQVIEAYNICASFLSAFMHIRCYMGLTLPIVPCNAAKKYRQKFSSLSATWWHIQEDKSFYECRYKT